MGCSTIDSKAGATIGTTVHSIPNSRVMSQNNLQLTFYKKRRRTENLVSIAGLLLLTKLEVLGSLEAQLLLRLAFLALQSQDDLLGRLSL